MKKTFIFAFGLMAAVALMPSSAFAATTYYYLPSTTQYQQTVTLPYAGGTALTQSQLIAYLQQLILQLQAQLAAQNSNYYYNSGYYSSGSNYVIGQPRGSGDRDDDRDRYDDDEPEAYTDTATNIDRYEARLRGEVDMNDFDDGEVFFVYGTDEGQIEDVERDYDSYRDVDTDGKRLQKVRVDSGLDGSEDYSYTVSDLSRDTDYYYQICVGYEDYDGDDALACGGVENFTTDY